ncbi:MAG: hypothetical protein JWP89_4002 [Schlesneria sp.]|nr:hypothetical protein [Schlesneria sp.]
MRYIEVLTSARMEHEIEAFEATLALSTATGKKVICFDEALALREAVLATLRKSGLTDAEIREGGGEAEQNTWSSTKTVVHRITIRNTSMDVLMSAMAATERHFASLPHSFFGRVKQDFTFQRPVPVYKANASASDALREAIRSAQTTATLLADELGVRLGGMLSVVEHFVTRNGTPERSVSYGGRGYSVEEDSIDAEPIETVSYAGLPVSPAKVARQFRIRFAVENAEQGNDHPV